MGRSVTAIPELSRTSNAFRARAFLAFADFEFYLVIFLEWRAIGVGHVEEQIFATFVLDETKTFICIEELYGTFTHGHSL
jgi:hypothetical protein